MPFALKFDRFSAATESPSTESPGTESPGTESPGAESPGAESPGAESPGSMDSRDGDSPTGMLRGRSRAGEIPAALLAMALALFFSGCGTSHPGLTLDGGPPSSGNEEFAAMEANRNEEKATGTDCGESDIDALRLARKNAHYNLTGVAGKAGYRVRYSLPRDLAERGPFCVEVEAEAVRP